MQSIKINHLILTCKMSCATVLKHLIVYIDVDLHILLDIHTCIYIVMHNKQNIVRQVTENKEERLKWHSVKDISIFSEIFKHSID